MSQPPFGPPSGPPGPPPPPGYGPGNGPAGPQGYGQQPPPPGYGQPPAPGFGQQPPAYQQQAAGHPAGPAFAPGYGVPPTPQKSSGKGVKIAAAGIAGALGLSLLGGGALFAYSKVNGSGPQPEEALPASALAFAKVDLDPSAGQKVDAYRFLRKFPGATEELGNPSDDADLRKVIFDAIQKDGGLQGLSYEQDVEPWIGDRFGAALLAGGEGGEPTGVVALAVTDADKARTALGKVTGTDGGYCTVADDFAICGEAQTVVDKAVNDAKGANLADSASFSEDMDALGEDGLATFWADGEALSKAISPQNAMGGMVGSGLSGTSQAGRVAMALRFDGPHLELAGTSTGEPGKYVSDEKTSVESLPADTVGAVSVRGLGPAVQQQWGELESSMKQTLGDTEWQSGLDEIKQATGLSLPGDLSALLGDDTTVSMGGPTSDGMPKIALRSNGEKAKADTLLSTLSSGGGSPMPLVTKDGQDGMYVLATEDGYGQHVASGSGLGDNDVFKDAVPDAGDANVVVFVNVQEAVKAYGSDMDDETRRNVEPIGAIGMSGTTDGDRSDFRLRLTTK